MVRPNIIPIQYQDDAFVIIVASQKHHLSLSQMRLEVALLEVNIHHFA